MEKRIDEKDSDARMAFREVYGKKEKVHFETVKKAVAVDAARHINEAEKAAQDDVINATARYSAELNAMEKSRDSEAEKARG